MYGCIDETKLSLRFPRRIDGDERETIEGAWEQALQMLIDGAEKISICQVKYYGADGNGFWGETDQAFQSISIEASTDVEWLRKEETVS
jgi:hypothetical protein